MTAANLARHRNNPNFEFWKMIKRGNDDFLVSRAEPKVDVCDRRYVFDAAPPKGSSKPLVFDPTGPCPSYQLDPTIADAVKAKERRDASAFAALVRQNVPTAALNTGTDGGMNRVFASKLATATYTYDSKGHLHVPPMQPGRPPPAISPPRGSESDMQAAVAAPPARSESSLNPFARLFSSQASAEPQAAATAATTADASAKTPAPKRSATANARKPKPAASPKEQAEAAKPKPKPGEKAGEHPGEEASAQQAEGAKPKPKAGEKAGAKQADAGKPKPKADGGQQDDAFGPPPSNAGLTNGAQPTVPSGSFDSRWQGMR
jgi:hypothetical protein